MKKMCQTKLILAALLVLGPMAAHADFVTWEFSGLIGDTDRPGVSIGDAFSVHVTFDTDAALVTTQTGGRFNPGARYEYDPSGMSFVVNIPGLIDQVFTPGAGFNVLWLRDNSGDRFLGGEPEQVDGLSFALEGADFLVQAGVFRGSILDIFDGPGLPSSPDPRLVDLEISGFFIQTSDGFANGRILSVRSVPEPVTIDIKPGSDPNCFNVNGHGVIPVAVLGSDTFDVTNIDQSSLLFGGLEVRIRGKKGPLCNLDYSNGDAYLDLVCHFEDDAANWSVGSENATLSGTLFDGSEFEGTDSICVVP